MQLVVDLGEPYKTSNIKPEISMKNQDFKIINKHNITTNIKRIVLANFLLSTNF